MKKGVFYLKIIKEPYRISVQDQSHYFLCLVGREFTDDCDILYTAQLNAIEAAEIIEISVTAFYKRLNKWGWESERLYDQKKAITLTSKDDIGNAAWNALSDRPRNQNLGKIQEPPALERKYCTPVCDQE